MQPLTREFPHFYNKEDLALPGELKPFANRASLMAAIDYIVSENSDVFMPSHGGNMGHAIQVQSSITLFSPFPTFFLLIAEASIHASLADFSK